MGTTRFKVTYQCECGEDWGSCGKRSFFLFSYNRSCDIGALYHKHHADNQGSKLDYLGHFDDTALDALRKILSMSDPDEQWDTSDEIETKSLQ